jgi:hypothetical protein
MSVNFNTNNLVIFQYPTGAGGKFVAACCGLSSGMVLSSDALACRQLLNTFSSSDKLSHLTRTIKNIGSWNDFELGCNQLFGIAIDDYDKMPDHEISQRFKPVVETLSHSNLKFPVIAHTPYVCKLGLNKWPNARIVQFNNNQEFYKKFRPGKIHYDEQASLNVSNDMFNWDQQAVLDNSKFLDQIEELYDWLDLKDFDSKLVTEFYNVYIASIAQLVRAPA